MRLRRLTLPEIALIAGTRAALGAGAGMLMSDRLDRKARKGAGWALLLVGIATTIPLAMNLLSRPRGFTRRLLA
jgi:hypothetical protein